MKGGERGIKRERERERKRERREEKWIFDNIGLKILSDTIIKPPLFITYVTYLGHHIYQGQICKVFRIYFLQSYSGGKGPRIDKRTRRWLFYISFHAHRLCCRATTRTRQMEDTHFYTADERKRKGMDIDRKKGKVEVGEQGRRENEKRVCSNN